MEEEGRTEISFPFVFRPANVKKDDGKSKSKRNYADKNNAKVAEIGHAEEEDEEEEKKKRKRKTKEEIPVMNGGCSRFNESPKMELNGK